MECQAKDSKRIFKVFEATKHKKTRKKHKNIEDLQSVASDGSNDRRGTDSRHVSSTKGSFHEFARSPNRNLADELHGKVVKERHSDQSVHNSLQGETAHRSRPRRHRRAPREEVSLALRAGLVSTPRSISPHQNCEGGLSTTPRDENSFMDGLLEEAVKQDRRKHRQSRRHEDHASRDRRETSPSERRRHRHRDELDKENKSRKEEKSSIDQAVLLETFLKLCSQMQANPGRITRTHSNKSLQCGDSRHRIREHHQGRSREASKHNMSPIRIRSNDDCRSKIQTRDRKNGLTDEIQSGYDPYEKNRSKYASRLNMNQDLDERLRGYPLQVNPTRCQIDLPGQDRSYREYERKVEKSYDEDRRMFGQRTSRSFDVPREVYEDRNYRRTGRSDGVKNRSFDSGVCRDKMYEDRRYKYKDYYEPKDYHRDYVTKQNKIYRSQNIDLDRASLFSTDDDFRHREKYVDRDRDSGLSVADESIASCKSNYLRAVKQEITEQREAMDKMMKLWKELMRAFKGPSQTREPTKSIVGTSANVRESAAAQLQLWRECMRRYETVARDVGDTDARLMEEINKQRSEMAEMTSMFQECLRRYNDMSKDFNTLKQQLQSESPVRLPAAPHPPPHPAPHPPPGTNGDGVPPSATYRLPSAYPPHMAGMPPHMGMGGGYPPLHPQLVAPPPAPCCRPERGYSPRRRSSPDSRAYRDHRHRDRDRGESRCKEKCKPSGTRSEHRHRKR